MHKDRDLLVYNVITTNDGGGAELLVRYLTESLHKYQIKAYSIYGQSAKNTKLSINEINLNLKSPKSIKFIFRLRRFLKSNNKKHNNKIKILHLHLTWPLIYGLIASYGLNYKIIYTEHNTFNKRRKIPLGRIFDFFLYKNCQKIICISNDTKKALLKWQLNIIKKEKIHVINNGARKYKFKKRSYSKNKGLNIISIGSLTYQKGFDVSINSISLISDQVDSYVILGEGEMRKQLEEIIDKSNLTSKIKLVGFVDDIQKYLDQSNLALVPSRWEGFSLASIEMISSGLPLLINKNYGGPKDVINCKSVYLRDLSTSSKIAYAIKNIKKDLIKNKNIFSQAISISEKFSLESFSKNYSKIYKSIK